MNVLLVDDEPNVLKTLTIVLTSIGLNVSACRSPEEALDLLRRSNDFDLAFFDLKMYPIDGIALMERMRDINPRTTVVIITAHGTVETAVEALKRGAYDYLLKPIELDDLRRFVERAVAYHRLKEENTRLRTELAQSTGVQEAIVTRDPTMLGLIGLAERIADTPLPVLIEGESGTGKELFAFLIHRSGARSAGPFVRVNCAALPENLLESELFGHARGSFTGAHKDRVGRFEMANRGTILLDEVGELPLLLQAKLLRVLQSGEFERLGESTTRRVDVRVVAATNRDLEKEMREGRFREDLYYRLNGVKLRVPPLRERPEDLPILIYHFMAKYAQGGGGLGISIEALAALKGHDWKGNVRELENIIARAAFLATGELIDVADLPEEMRARPSRDVGMSLEAMEKDHIAKVIASSKSFEEAARKLQIDAATLWRKRKKYDL